MAEDVAEATESLPKEAGLVGLDRPLDQLDLTKMLAESFEPEEQEGFKETSPSGDAVEETHTACGCTFVIIRFRGLAREYCQFVHIVFCRFPSIGRERNKLFP